MITADVKVSGPVLTGRINLLSANLRAGNEIERLLGPRVRAAYTGGIVNRGPGRYGHLGDSIRTRTTVINGAAVTIVGPSGKAAFKASILEEGARAHFIGARAFGTAFGTGRRRQRKGRRRALAIRVGGGVVFRPYAHHPGIQAFRPLERVRVASERDFVAIQKREIRKELGA